MDVSDRSQLSSWADEISRQLEVVLSSLAIDLDPLQTTIDFTNDP